jgi:7-carboxy-7-deazaguanine synthase
MQISEIFHSIQGEGRKIGLPTVFVRTTGCNLRCTYCDTQYAYSDGKEMTLDSILSKITNYHCQQICITGGEPLLQQETIQLIESLQKQDYEICLETNGTQPIKNLRDRNHLQISMDLKTPSSTMHKHNLFENMKYLTKNDQLKCIIGTKEDYQYAKDILKKYQIRCPVILQPVWGFNPQVLADWILSDQLSVRLGLQIHKIIWGGKTHK